MTGGVLEQIAKVSPTTWHICTLCSKPKLIVNLSDHNKALLDGISFCIHRNGLKKQSTMSFTADNEHLELLPDATGVEVKITGVFMYRLIK